MVDVRATGMMVWVVENRIAMKRSQGIGSIDKASRRVLIRIDTDAGVRGYGEAAPWAVFSGTVESAVAGLTKYFWPHVKGARVTEIPKIIDACERAAVGHPEAKAAIEVALYDIVGRAIATIAEQAGLPCYGGTLWEGAIALNAGAHLIAATGNISLGCEFYMPRYVFSPEELEAPLDLRDGYVYPAEGPGLGIDVDEDVIARTAIETLTLP